MQLHYWSVGSPLGEIRPPGAWLAAKLYKAVQCLGAECFRAVIASAEEVWHQYLFVAGEALHGNGDGDGGDGP